MAILIILIYLEPYFILKEIIKGLLNFITFIITELLIINFSSTTSKAEPKDEVEETEEIVEKNSPHFRPNFSPGQKSLKDFEDFEVKEETRDLLNRATECAILGGLAGALSSKCNPAATASGALAGAVTGAYENIFNEKIEKEEKKEIINQLKDLEERIEKIEDKLNND